MSKTDTGTLPLNSIPLFRLLEPDLVGRGGIYIERGGGGGGRGIYTERERGGRERDIYRERGGGEGERERESVREREREADNWSFTPSESILVVPREALTATG